MTDKRLEEIRARHSLFKSNGSHGAHECASEIAKVLIND